jgi:hypothetical protein
MGLILAPGETIGLSTLQTHREAHTLSQSKPASSVQSEWGMQKSEEKRLVDAMLPAMPKKGVPVTGDRKWDEKG